MQGLIDISPVSSEKNVRDLRRMLDSVQVHMRGLKALGVGEESYEAILHPVLLRPLPRELVLGYHRARAEERGKGGAATSTEDAASMTSSSSRSSQRPPLRHLLKFFGIE
ncbi:hypothetical protein HPB50_007048 [Hyalomma asiaticum]|uniref:Uncharacterized protein n=1 Tax=Hyalomma asiaticum TaxID=266040 RepID=A0ACB7S4J5_HYAAI|nr:hypothetical protein HPB50_007048 [Hyalomma asiaticum]